jgi:hypothetical protein
MIGPELPFREESDQKLVFAGRPWLGLVAVAFAGGLMYLLFVSTAPTYVIYIFGAFCSLFFIAGLTALFWRHALTIDLVTRVYSHNKGFWPFVKAQTGSLDELEGVTLTTGRGNHDDNEPAFAISLLFRDWKKPVGILVTPNELEGHKKLRHWAVKLGVKAIDRTGVKERIFTVAEMCGNGGFASALQPHTAKAYPAGLRKGRCETISTGGSQTVIILPRREISAGFVLEAVMVTIFASGFLFFGGMGLSSLLTGHPVIEGPRFLLFIVSPLFIGVAVTAVLVTIIRSWGREWLEVYAYELAYGRRMFGRVWRKVCVQREEIQDIDIKQYDWTFGKIKTVTVLSDCRILRIGTMLEPDELEWLSETLRSTLQL